MDLTDESHSIYNQIKRGDLEGVKIGAGTHKRLANVPFKITSKATGESHIVVTDKNGQFSTASDWASHKKIQMQGNPVRTVSGSEHQSQTTAKGHYFMTLMRLRS